MSFDFKSEKFRLRHELNKRKIFIIAVILNHLITLKKKAKKKTFAFSPFLKEDFLIWKMAR